MLNLCDILSIHRKHNLLANIPQDEDIKDSRILKVVYYRDFNTDSCKAVCLNFGYSRTMFYLIYYSGR